MEKYIFEIHKVISTKDIPKFFAALWMQAIIYSYFSLHQFQVLHRMLIIKVA